MRSLLRSRLGANAPVHDRGKVLVQSMLMLAGGGESCADIEHLRAQGDLFGSAPSDSTVFRTFHEITPEVRHAVAEAFAEVRAEVWQRSSATNGTAPVILDIDASLVEIHTETKEGTGPHYKGGWGFHPMFCFADATGEALSGILRPGNAGANTVADHVRVLDDAISQLPDRVAAGHHVGDDAALVTRSLVVRTDSAGCSHGFVWAARGRNIGFFVVARSNTQIHSAIFDTVGLEEFWEPALHQDGSPREGAAVAELTELVDLSEWPEGTRLIVRREPLHPGAQHSLFPSLEYRYWGHYTDQDGEPVELDQSMRAHAHVELHIARLKDSGLLAFPFSDLEANRTWMAAVMMAADLVRWFQLLCLHGSWARPDRRLCDGASSTPRGASSVPDGVTSSASWPAGPVPTRYSAHIKSSTPFTEPSQSRSVVTPSGPPRPEATSEPKMTTETDHNGATTASPNSQIASMASRALPSMASRRSQDFS